MKPLNEEIQYLTAASKELAEYLLAEVAHWRLEGPQSLPPLTPGYVLLYLRRLNGWPTWAPEEQLKVGEINQKIAAIRAQWHSAWLQKSRQEVHQRLRLWRDYLLETEQERKSRFSGIRWQVRWRVMVDLLLEDIGHFDPAIAHELDSLDRRLRTLFAPGQFLWEHELMGSFPQEKFWYLYLKA